MFLTIFLIYSFLVRESLQSSDSLGPCSLKLSSSFCLSLCVCSLGLGLVRVWSQGFWGKFEVFGPLRALKRPALSSHHHGCCEVHINFQKFCSPGTKFSKKKKKPQPLIWVMLPRCVKRNVYTKIGFFYMSPLYSVRHIWGVHGSKSINYLVLLLHFAD